MDIDTQMKALGQKYLGIRPKEHAGQMFGQGVSKDFDISGGHAIPVNVCPYPPQACAIH